MKPASFTYARPTALDEAITLLRDAGARPLAGGQSLVPMLNLRLAPVDLLVDLGRITALRDVRDTPEAVIYGAGIRHAAFEDGLVPDVSNGLMRHVAARFAYRAVRNRGTIGGALALADPAADWLLTVVTLEGKLHLQGADGARVVAAEEFVLGPYFTALGEGELITAVEIPRRPASERWGYSKVTTKIGEYAESMALTLFDKAGGKARLVLGAADGAPIVLREAAAAWLAGASGEALRPLIFQELDAVEREFSAAKRHMHATTLLRATQDAAK
ncbi:FAD binding domain-containing protein [Ferrovibrio sp.]|uniref:FAD binding domain-containing protein n=1 Tax=Ferrovibrio sp. TaxID=1917215 RepID=UPI003D10E433